MLSESKWERTLVLIKPDAVERGLIGEIISRFERKGLNISEMEMFQLRRCDAEKHYIEHIGKDFFQRNVEFLCSGSIVAMMIEGINAISTVRTMIGSSNPANAVPGTIRFDYSNPICADGEIQIHKNLVHASDSTKSAEREIGLYFPHIRTYLE